MKIIRSEQAEQYQPPGHFDMEAYHLHNKDEEGTLGRIALGRSVFHPGGGVEYSVANDKLDLIYYIQSGEMTLTKQSGESIVLTSGDSVRFQPGDGRSMKNEGTTDAVMLVCVGFCV